MNMIESLPSARKDALHRDERPERVAVGVLVRDDEEPLGAADLGRHELTRLGGVDRAVDRRGLRRRVRSGGLVGVGHLRLSSISSSTRRARSPVSS